MDEAHEALARGALDEADALADALIAMKWSGGFEIRALVLRARGELDAAIAVARASVEKVPADPSLWLLLANLSSEASRFEEAEAAYAEALARSGDPVARYNRAVSRARSDRPDAAWDDLEVVLALPEPPPFAEEAIALAASCLDRLGRAEDAVALVSALRERCAADDPRRARLDAELALALHRARADDDAVRGPLTAALDGEVVTPALAALVRARAGAVARPAMRHRVLVSVATSPVAGYARVFELVLAPGQSALSYVRDFVRARARDAIAIERDERVAECEAEPGVHGASPIVPFAEG